MSSKRLDIDLLSLWLPSTPSAFLSAQLLHFALTASALHIPSTFDHERCTSSAPSSHRFEFAAKARCDADGCSTHAPWIFRRFTSPLASESMQVGYVLGRASACDAMMMILMQPYIHAVAESNLCRVHLRVHVSTASITLRARHTVLRKQEQAGKGTAVRSICVIEMQDPSSDAIYSYLSMP